MQSRARREQATTIRTTPSRLKRLYRWMSEQQCCYGLNTDLRSVVSSCLVAGAGVVVDLRVGFAKEEADLPIAVRSAGNVAAISIGNAVCIEKYIGNSADCNVAN